MEKKKIIIIISVTPQIKVSSVFQIFFSPFAPETESQKFRGNKKFVYLFAVHTTIVIPAYIKVIPAKRLSTG